MITYTSRKRAITENTQRNTICWMNWNGTLDKILKNTVTLECEIIFSTSLKTKVSESTHCQIYFLLSHTLLEISIWSQRYKIYFMHTIFQETQAKLVWIVVAENFLQNTSDWLTIRIQLQINHSLWYPSNRVHY